MKAIGNLIWFVCGGLVMGLAWWLAGLIAFVSIVGIPWGRACFVIGKLCFFPFGRVAVSRQDVTNKGDIGTGVLGFIGNVIWFVLFGLWLADRAPGLGAPVFHHDHRHSVRTAARQAGRDRAGADRQDHRGEVRKMFSTRGPSRIAATLFLMAAAGVAERLPVLKQIDEPHPYYFREMYLPQVTSGPSAAAWSPDGRGARLRDAGDAVAPEARVDARRSS